MVLIIKEFETDLYIEVKVALNKGIFTLMKLTVCIYMFKHGCKFCTAES